MSRLINFNNYSVPRSSKVLAASSRNSDIPNSEIPCLVMAHDSFKLNFDVLVKNYPGKLLFSLKEASNMLRVSDEFIRRRIKSGKIKATYLGDKPFINIVELARIVTEGV